MATASASGASASRLRLFMSKNIVAIKSDSAVKAAKRSRLKGFTNSVNRSMLGLGVLAPTTPVPLTADASTDIATNAITRVDIAYIVMHHFSLLNALVTSEYAMNAFLSIRNSAPNSTVSFRRHAGFHRFSQQFLDVAVRRLGNCDRRYVRSHSTFLFCLHKLLQVRSGLKHTRQLPSWFYACTPVHDSSK